MCDEWNIVGLRRPLHIRLRTIQQISPSTPTRTGADTGKTVLVMMKIPASSISTKTKKKRTWNVLLAPAGEYPVNSFQTQSPTTSRL